MLIDSVEKWNALWDHFGEIFVAPLSGDLIHVLRKCDQCGRILTVGKIREDLAHQLSFEDFSCCKHGEVEPFFIRDHRRCKSQDCPKPHQILEEPG